MHICPSLSLIDKKQMHGDKGHSLKRMSTLNKMQEINDLGELRQSIMGFEVERNEIRKQMTITSLLLTNK